MSLSFVCTAVVMSMQTKNIYAQYKYCCSLGGKTVYPNNANLLLDKKYICNICICKIYRST